MSEDNKSVRKIVNTLTHNSGSIDRMKVAAHMINVFNFAILTQAGRPQWNEHDMRCLAIALAAVDQIGDELPTNEVQSSEEAEERIGNSMVDDLNRIAGAEHRSNGNGQRRHDDRLPRQQFLS